MDETLFISESKITEYAADGKERYHERRYSQHLLDRNWHRESKRVWSADLSKDNTMGTKQQRYFNSCSSPGSETLRLKKTSRREMRKSKSPSPSLSETSDVSNYDSDSSCHSIRETSNEVTSSDFRIGVDKIDVFTKTTPSMSSLKTLTLYTTANRLPAPQLRLAPLKVCSLDTKQRREETEWEDEEKPESLIKILLNFTPDPNPTYNPYLSAMIQPIRILLHAIEKPFWYGNSDMEGIEDDGDLLAGYSRTNSSVPKGLIGPQDLRRRYRLTGFPSQLSDDGKAILALELFKEDRRRRQKDNPFSFYGLLQTFGRGKWIHRHNRTSPNTSIIWDSKLGAFLSQHMQLLYPIDLLAESLTTKSSSSSSDCLISSSVDFDQSTNSKWHQDNYQNKSNSSPFGVAFLI